MQLWRIHKAKLFVLSQRITRSRHGQNRRRSKCDSKHRIRCWKWLKILIKQFLFFNLQLFRPTVAVITLCLNEPVYIIKVKEKGSATEPLHDMHGHNISTEELYLRGNYLKTARSKNISRKNFQIKKFEFIIPPDEVFVAFVEVTDYFPMSAKDYLAFYEQAK